MSLLIFSFPNRMRVPGAPMTPASSRGVPAGLAVTSGGRFSPRINHSSNSASAQNRPAGPHGPLHPHGLHDDHGLPPVLHEPHVPELQPGPVPVTVGGLVACGASDGDG